MNPSSKPTLDPRPARRLTDRECVQVLSGLIGSLIELNGVEPVKRAVLWLQQDEYWKSLENAMSQIYQAMAPQKGDQG